jgi:serine/threonine-protein kinase
MAADITPSKAVEGSRENQSTGPHPPAPQPQTVDDRPVALEGAPPLPSRPTFLELGEEIARGGMGAVYRARDQVLHRDLAVKVLLDRLADRPDSWRRFAEEARVAGRLQHPGVPPVYEVGVLPDGRPFIAMKLIQGRTLAALLAERRGSTPPLADLPRFLGVFEQVCQTLAYAHSQGVIHRDLKPLNVMVGAFAEVQVMDWGLAKVLRGAVGPVAPAASAMVESGRQESQAGTILGTPAYMAPEQARGEVERLDERADVFGLGAILCEMLTGKPPFAGPDIVGRAARAELSEALARLEGCGADPELIAIATSCLAADREARPRDAGAVAERVTAYRACVQERLRQAELERAAAQAKAAEERKRRRLTAGLAAAVLLAVVVGGGAAWYLRQQHLDQVKADERRVAEQAQQEADRRREVDRDLAEVTALQKTDDWEKGWQALRRAEGRLAGSTDETLRRRVAQVRDDQEMLVKLDEARLRRASPGTDKEIWDMEGADKLYRQAFAGYDLELGHLSVEEGARRVVESRLVEPLLVALEDWSYITQDARLAKHLWAIVNRADGNEWRRHLRQRRVARDQAALRRLAEKPVPEGLSSFNAYLLARGLESAGEPQKALGGPAGGASAKARRLLALL